MWLKELFTQKCKFAENVQDVDEIVSSSKCSMSLAHQWILCSEWVPSVLESKHYITNNI